MGTASLVHTFCGLYLPRGEPSAVLANPGLAAEMAGLLELRLHSQVIGISREGDWKIKVAGEAGFLVARSLVDASGDAVVAPLLGVGSAMVEAPRLQRPAYVVGFHHAVPMDDDARLQTAGFIVQGIRAGDFPADALGMAFRGTGRAGEIFRNARSRGRRDHRGR